MAVKRRSTVQYFLLVIYMKVDCLCESRENKCFLLNFLDLVVEIYFLEFFVYSGYIIILSKIGNLACDFM